MFNIKRRSTGEIAIEGFSKREVGKPMRNRLNKTFYNPHKVPKHNREYYIVRSSKHRRGASK